MIDGFKFGQDGFGQGRRFRSESTRVPSVRPVTPQVLLRRSLVWSSHCVLNLQIHIQEGIFLFDTLDFHGVSILVLAGINFSPDEVRTTFLLQAFLVAVLIKAGLGVSSRFKGGLGIGQGTQRGQFLFKGSLVFYSGHIHR